MRRAAIAAALATSLLAAFAALGSVGAAQSTIGAAQYQYGKKVTICHKGHTISVGKAAEPAHVRHGDSVGTCAALPQGQEGQGCQGRRCQGRGCREEAGPQLAGARQGERERQRRKRLGAPTPRSHRKARPSPGLSVSRDKKRRGRAARGIARQSR